jgi:hypothetical protein
MYIYPENWNAVEKIYLKFTYFMIFNTWNIKAYVSAINKLACTMDIFSSPHCDWRKMSFQKLPLLLSSGKSMQPVLLGLLNGISLYPMSGEAELCSESCVSLSNEAMEDVHYVSVKYFALLRLKCFSDSHFPLLFTPTIYLLPHASTFVFCARVRFCVKI